DYYCQVCDSDSDYRIF
nr:immunoglobulin light chain junction region [Macaca mulatta]